MPLYSFLCDTCGLHYDELFRMNEKKNSTCPQCKTVARRIFSVGKPNFGFQPYWSDNLSPNPGQRVYIESRQQKQSLLQKYGLAESGRTSKKEI